jgi:hypothetical protein
MAPNPMLLKAAPKPGSQILFATERRPARLLRAGVAGRSGAITIRATRGASATHYTPKHGSWLNLAESELGVLASQCLDRRIPDKQTIADEVAAWVEKRNADHAAADWRFTTQDARLKLKSLTLQSD